VAPFPPRKMHEQSSNDDDVRGARIESEGHMEGEFDLLQLVDAPQSLSFSASSTANASANASASALLACMHPTPLSPIDLSEPKTTTTPGDPATVYYVSPGARNCPNKRLATEARLCWGAMLKDDAGAVACTRGFSICTKPHPKLKDQFCTKCCQDGIDIPVERVRALSDNADATFKNKHSTGFWKTWKSSEDGDVEDARVVNHTKHCDGPTLVIFPQAPRTEQRWADVPEHWITDNAIRFVVAKDTLVPAATMHNKKPRTNSHSSPVLPDPPTELTTASAEAELMASQLLTSYQHLTAVVTDSLEPVTAVAERLAPQDKAKLCEQLARAQNAILAVQCALSQST